MARMILFFPWWSWILALLVTLAIGSLSVLLVNLIDEWGHKAKI